MMILNKHNKNSPPPFRLASFFWILSSALCAIYFFGALARSGVAFDVLESLPKTFVIYWKAVCELLLVFVAWMVAESRTSRVLALAVTIIFVADMFLALGAVSMAGFIFVIAHLISVYAYLKSPSSSPANSTINAAIKWLSIIPISLVILLIVWSLSKSTFQLIALFPAFSALVAYSALRSSYPIAMTGIGTVLFWISDCVFVVTVLVTGDATSVGWLVWLTFSSGLLLIVLGLMTKSRRELHELRSSKLAI